MEGPMKNLFDPAGKVALSLAAPAAWAMPLPRRFCRTVWTLLSAAGTPKAPPNWPSWPPPKAAATCPVYCDITKEEDVEKMGDIIEKELGPVTMLVNSAGMNILKHGRGLRRRVLQ